jgi:hypothetical protein
VHEALLIIAIARLTSYTRFGFQIKADAWRKILGCRRFVVNNCPIEFEQKKIVLDAYINGTWPSQLKRRKFYEVRIGNKSEQSPNKIEEQIGWDGRIIITPPRLNGLGIKTQSFQRLADPFIWNFIVENNTDDKGK